MGVGLNDGYGYAAIRLIEAWQRAGVSVWWGDTDAPVAFSMGQPPWYEYILGAINIGYTPWESTEIPKTWIKKMNQMDEIWTTCEQNASDYRRVLDIPVMVLHHGIQRPEWPVKKREWQHDTPFKFLHIGGHAPRKGAQMTYECFKDLFGEDTDVRLILKGYGFKDLKPQGKNVEVIRDMYSHQEMIDLYLDCHAMVYPCKGEGFGLIPFQAASTGMPTAVTDWSGPADYMERCFPISIDGLDDSVYDPHLGKWAVPSKHDIEFWMLDFAEYHHYYFDQAFMKATFNEEYWSWDSRANFALERMTGLLNGLGREKLR